MKSFSTFVNVNLNESILVYRGIPVAGQDKLRDVTWVSTNRKHAEMYSDSLTAKDSGKGEVLEYKITKTLVPLDLQFVNAEVDVKYNDVRGRLNDAIINRFSEKKLTRETALKLTDELRNLNFSGLFRVHEWMNKKPILNVIKKAGFNAILQREGMKFGAGNIITYGILDKSILSKVK